MFKTYLWQLEGMQEIIDNIFAQEPFIHKTYGLFMTMQLVNISPQIPRSKMEDVCSKMFEHFIHDMRYCVCVCVCGRFPVCVFLLQKSLGYWGSDRKPGMIFIFLLNEELFKRTPESSKIKNLLKQPRIAEESDAGSRWQWISWTIFRVQPAEEAWLPGTCQGFGKWKTTAPNQRKKPRFLGNKQKASPVWILFFFQLQWIQSPSGQVCQVGRMFLFGFQSFWSHRCTKKIAR